MIRTTLRRISTTVGAVTLASVLAGTAAASAGASTSWPTYHATSSRQGTDPGEKPLSPAKQAWKVTLDGAVYGQPVIAGGRAFVATENDSVYALNAHNGAVIWHRSLGSPLRNVSSQAGCGDIDPLGITSTPAIDPKTGTVYVVGEVASAGGNAPVHHQLVGFNPATGAVLASDNADPPVNSVSPSGQRLISLQQRGALNIGNGRVYISYGGLAGDCGVYHGWEVGINETGAPHTVSFNATPGGQGGAIWEAGGPTIGSNGDVYLTTGNPNNPQNTPVGYSESVVKLDPSLDSPPLAHYRDTQATGDADLSTQGPALLNGTEVFAAGKTDIGYLLNASTFAVVAKISGVCGSDPDGGSAFSSVTQTLYVPCRGGGIQAVNIKSRTLGARIGGVNGSPILVNGLLWAAQDGSSSLYQFDPKTGKTLQTLNTGSTVPTFGSPSAADGLVMIGTDDGVTAFEGPKGPPPGPTPAAPPAGLSGQSGQSGQSIGAVATAFRSLFTL